MLHPRKVGVALRRGAVLPAHIVFQLGTPPLLHIERRVSHHEVGAKIRVLVVQQRICVFAAEVEVDATDCHVHRRQFPGGRVGFLAVNGNLLLLLGGVVLLLARMLFNEAIAGHEEPAGTHRRVINAAVIRLEHFDNQGHDAFWRVVLPTLLTFCQRELTEEIFVYVAENIFAL